jgi:hypothetical protein
VAFRETRPPTDTTALTQIPVAVKPPVTVADDFDIISPTAVKPVAIKCRAGSVSRAIDETTEPVVVATD